jgi:OOP family OmpA-OmpF porin
MFKKIAGASLILAMSAATLADEIPGVTVSPMIGYTFLKDDIENAGHWSLGLGYQFNNPWAIEFVYADLSTDITGQTVDLDFTRWQVDGLYHTEQIGDIRPYFALGLGEADYDFSTGQSDNDTLVNVGVGAKYALGGSNTSLRGDLRLFNGSGSDAAYLAMSLGIQHVFGQAKAKAKAQTKAAPMMAMKNETQALDSDNDGIMDNIDKCPTTPQGVDVNAMGCPRDDDGDGVANYEDKCPNTTDRRAMIEATGCYKMLKESVRVDLMVEFDNNSSQTRAEHRAEVRKIFEFMTSYPNTRVTIEGHTDSRGAAEYNKNLSQRRADSIAELLISDFGIKRSRVSAEGFGEERPIASNETNEGRQHNRRVVGVVVAVVEKIEKMK